MGYITLRSPAKTRLYSDFVPQASKSSELLSKTAETQSRPLLHRLLPVTGREPTHTAGIGRFSPTDPHIQGSP